MTFLNLALLGGLAALSIPIIIHLFHKSRFERVRWGAMHLLEAVIRQNQRRVRIEQIILLIIRAAIPAVLALAMARPVWKGVQRLLGEARTSTVILLDNSYSMDAGRAGVSNFTLAKEEVKRIVGDLRRGSEVQVVLMGAGGASLFDEPTGDMARVNHAIDELSANYGAASIPGALDFAAGVLGQMHEPTRNVVVMTDFQRTSFPATEDAQLGQMIERLKKQPVAPSITFFNIGEEVKDNVAIESLEYPKLMVGVGQKIQVRANLRNFGDVPYSDLRVYFKADGKEKGMSQIALPAHQKGQVLFTHTFDAPGSHVLEVYADADALKADNGYMASIPVRDKVPVLLVNGDPSPDPLKGETDFAEIALQPFSAGRVEMADLLKTTVIKTEELDARRLAETAVVILANARRLNDGQLQALEEFVKNGGGLLIFPGNRIDPQWYESAMFTGGKGLLPLAFGALAGDLAEKSPAVSVVAQHFENPALELFNDPRNGSLSEAAIKVWFKMKTLDRTPAPGDPAILARLESGDPFLVEKQFGEGRVIECSTAVDADWSNFPMRPSYLPFLQRLSVHLASTVFPSRNLESGKPVVALLSAGDVGKEVRITNPDGVTAALKIVKKGERGVAEFGRTTQSGLYTLTTPAGETVHYVVTASRRESDLQKLTDKEIADVARDHHVDLVRSGAEYKALDHTRRYGSEQWKTLLAILLALCFLEIFLQQKFARVRSTPSRNLDPQMVPAR